MIGSGFPQHYAAASLKPLSAGCIQIDISRFPQHYAAASLKLKTPGSSSNLFSRFPQHYAAASLKQRGPLLTQKITGGFSAALRCGLIEAFCLC